MGDSGGRTSPLVSGARKCTVGAGNSFARAYLEGVQTGLGLSSSENFFSEKANAGAPQPLRARLFPSDNTLGALCAVLTNKTEVDGRFAALRLGAKSMRRPSDNTAGARKRRTAQETACGCARDTRAGQNVYAKDLSLRKLAFRKHSGRTQVIENSRNSPQEVVIGPTF